MFPWRKKSVQSAADAAAGLYTALVGEARRATYYRDFGVPDTVDGRFDMIVLHLALLLHRLADEGAAGAALRQALVDRFVADMDRSLREMGVSDLGMSRRMRQMVEAFYGRLGAYAPALAAGDCTALASAIERNVLGEATMLSGTKEGEARPGEAKRGEAGGAQAAHRLALQALAASRALGGQPRADLLSGRVAFPEAQYEGQLHEG